ncbi:putative poly(A)-specific ribonuclease [Helianthus annuus]|nr:putative poly(A)-specific ribonuclease [Helianthus annuus]
MFVHLLNERNFLFVSNKPTNTNELPALRFTNCSLNVWFVCSPSYNDISFFNFKCRLEEATSPRDHGDPNDPYVRLKRDCVGIMAAFKFKYPYQHYVIVTNTHIYWDPEWADVKLAQAKYLLSRVARFKKTVSEKYECTPSVLIAGDFNSVPGDKVHSVAFL